MRKKNLTKAVETTVAPNPKEVDIWVEPKDDKELYKDELAEIFMYFKNNVKF